MKDIKKINIDRREFCKFSLIIASGVGLGFASTKLLTSLAKEDTAKKNQNDINNKRNVKNEDCNLCSDPCTIPLNERANCSIKNNSDFIMNDGTQTRNK